MQVALVTTTIHVPILLESYMQDAMSFGHKDVSFIIIGDCKTPREAEEFCKDLRRRYHYETVFLDVNGQEAYLRSYPELASHLPYNSIQRRNIGMLLAYEQGADLVITIDDDNFLAEPDFIKYHSMVGQETAVDAYNAAQGWINVCDFLMEERGFRFYHRGFPLDARLGDNHVDPKVSSLKGSVVANAGFWLDEPDVDAVTRLAIPVKVIGFKRQHNFALGFGTWSPFNSQNTALARDVIPVYFLSPVVGRYDDIWASYVVKAIADHMGDLITFGHPLVRQKRNPHDYWIDLEKEKDGMRLTDTFCQYLRVIRFAGNSYNDCYKEAIDGLRCALDNDGTLKAFDRSFLEQYVAGMVVWNTTMSRVGEKAREHAT